MQSSNLPRITAESLQFSYGGAGSILHNLSFTAHDGEILCLFGGNRSGKTTFLKVLGGMEKPVSGSAQILSDISDVGFCVQFPEHLVYHDTVLAEAISITGNQRCAWEVLEDLSLTAQAEASPFGLSEGQKRMLFLLGFLRSKDVLIFDEPFASLDAAMRDMIVTSMETAKRLGKCVLYTANRMRDTVYADTVVTLERAE